MNSPDNSSKSDKVPSLTDSNIDEIHLVHEVEIKDSSEDIIPIPTHVQLPIREMISNTIKLNTLANTSSNKSNYSTTNSSVYAGMQDIGISINIKARPTFNLSSNEYLSPTNDESYVHQPQSHHRIPTHIDLNNFYLTPKPNISNHSRLNTPNFAIKGGIATPTFAEVYQPTFRISSRRKKCKLSLPSKIPPPKENFSIAMTYLIDVLKIRPPQRRVQVLSNAWFTPLKAYTWMKNWYWSRLIQTAIWLNMLLTIFEPPYLEHQKEMYTWSSDHIFISLITFQFMFIFIYAIDVALKFYSHDQHDIGQWAYVICVILTCNLFITFGTIFLYEYQWWETFYRSARIVRPLYLFYKSRDLKKLSRSILRGIPALFEVVTLITLFLLLFGFGAYYLFYESGIFGKNDSFSNFGEAIWSLFVLQTTSNFPDVMMQSYHESEFAAIFFAVYNVLGIYFLMSLVLAVIYNNYSDHILKDVQRIKKIRECGLRESFAMLTYHQNHPDQQKYNRKKSKKKRRNVSFMNGFSPFPKSKINIRTLKTSEREDIKIDDDNDDDDDSKVRTVIFFDVFKKIMLRMRPDLHRIFDDEQELNDQLRYMYLAMADADNCEYDDGITEEQFIEQIFIFVEIDICKDIALANKLDVEKQQKLLRESRKTATDLGNIDDIHPWANAPFSKSIHANDNIHFNNESFDETKDDDDHCCIEYIKNKVKCMKFWEWHWSMNEAKNQWFIFRLKLIDFWQWKKQIHCCNAQTVDRIIFNARRLSSLRGGTPQLSENGLPTDSMRDDSVISLTYNITSAQKRHMSNSNRSAVLGLTDDMNNTLKTIASQQILKDSQFNVSHDFAVVEHAQSTWAKDITTSFSTFKISTEYIVNLLVVISTIIVIADLYYPGDYQWLATILVYIFVIEVILKLIAYGIDGYFDDHYNKLDFVITTTAFIFEIIINDKVLNVVVVFRIIRMLRLLRAFTRYRVILRTTKAVLSSFRALFVLQFCLAYMYAIIGMELYAGLITETKVKSLCDESIADADDVEMEGVVNFWCVIYDSLYYENNFNSFSHALVVQMELIVVNNWHVITRMFVETTTIWTRLYFLTNYVFGVAVVMNVLTAFVLDAFITQYDASAHVEALQDKRDSEMFQPPPMIPNHTHEDSEFGCMEDSIESKMYNVIRMFNKTEDEMRIYHYSRKLSKALLYEQLYPQLFQKENDKTTEILRVDTDLQFLTQITDRYQLPKLNSYDSMSQTHMSSTSYFTDVDGNAQQRRVPNQTPRYGLIQFGAHGNIAGFAPIDMELEEVNNGYEPSVPDLSLTTKNNTGINRELCSEDLISINMETAMHMSLEPDSTVATPLETLFNNTGTVRMVTFNESMLDSPVDENGDVEEDEEEDEKEDVKAKPTLNVSNNSESELL